jgi:hypothetical protein
MMVEQEKAKEAKTYLQTQKFLSTDGKVLVSLHAHELELGERRAHSHHHC